MAWDHLAITKPHLVYIILGGFTSLFMLCSSVIKERLYIGEATVATICGIIFGPHAADLISPQTWGNMDLITLEFTRIVLVVQCFAVGVELPQAYMQKHWRSVVFLLIPVMTFGWLVVSLFIWALFSHRLNWLDSLICAACVTATDPVLASSVVGKGKFAKRIPKHLRDLISCESGCNDGMAFPFIYLGLYLLRYRPDTNQVSLHWFCYTVLYECIFGAFFGFTVGYIARRLIRLAHEKDLIDRESFLVFYFVLALFCAGSGSLLGMDDLLVGFACGTGFSNDGWFTEKTEESHVSNVIDLLLNLTFFVYYGTIIPWEQFNSPVLIGTSPWRLVVLGILVLLFRRIPVMLLLKPFVPDIKTWREAFFAGHFGPIGVGALYVVILARAELETEETIPLDHLPTEPTEEGYGHLALLELIWPITNFLVICSIIVHGSSIAVFTLGKHINTMTITMSYTQGNDDSNWIDRLPRIQSRSKSSTSMRKPGESEESLEEKMPEYPPDALPKNFLRRQREEDRPRSKSRRRRSRKSTSSRAGGPVSKSAISPLPRNDDLEKTASADASDVSPESSPITQEISSAEASSPEAVSKESTRPTSRVEAEEEVFQEGGDTIFEDEQGNVLQVMHSGKDGDPKQRSESVENEAQHLMTEEDIQHGVSQKQNPEEEHPVRDAVNHAETQVKDAVAATAAGRQYGWKGIRGKMNQFAATRKAGSAKSSDEPPKAAEERRQGPARAYRFGRTVIVEDEDGEVIKKYDIPGPEGEERKNSHVAPERNKQRLQRMGTWFGVHHEGEDGEPGSSRPQAQRKKSHQPDTTEGDDSNIRFKIHGSDRKMSAVEFIHQIQNMDPRSRAEIVEESNAPERVKEEARADAAETVIEEEFDREELARKSSRADGGGLKKTTSNKSDMQAPGKDIPFHPVSTEVAAHSAFTPGETAAQRRRRIAESGRHDSDSEDDGTERVPPPVPGRLQSNVSPKGRARDDDEGETAAERRRRERALGHTQEESESDEDESKPRQPPNRGVPGMPTEDSQQSSSSGSRAASSPRQQREIRFAEPPQPPPGDSRRSGGGEKPGGSGSGNGKGSGGGSSKVRWKH
ncbi:MAG: hypothetical protein M1831_007572 [Alyxoria varia]|nr:MAG: hypothetical protein M1831_007572 [Alyxoria varia]